MLSNYRLEQWTDKMCSVCLKTLLWGSYILLPFRLTFHLCQTISEGKESSALISRSVEASGSSCTGNPWSVLFVTMAWGVGSLVRTGQHDSKVQKSEFRLPLWYCQSRTKNRLSWPIFPVESQFWKWLLLSKTICHSQGVLQGDRFMLGKWSHLD